MGSTSQSSAIRRVVVLALAAVVVIVLWERADPSDDPAGPAAGLGAGTSSTTTPPVRPAATGSSGSTGSPELLWQVTSVVDGDTVHVSRGGLVEKVRLIGIDTPERDECGYSGARDSLTGIIAGRSVTLTRGARTDRDQYGRLLRYVSAGGTDVGLAQITRGYAVARFDSRDGYGRHTREADYVAADLDSPDKGWACATPVPVKPQSGWPLPGDEHPCPQGRPVKGNEPSMIAHSPGQQSYLETNPEQCFATLGDAVAAGFRAAKR